MLLCWIVCRLASSSGQTAADLHPDADLYADSITDRHPDQHSYLHLLAIGDLTARYSQPDAQLVCNSYIICHPQPFGDDDRNHAAFGNCLQHAHLHSDAGAQPYLHSNPNPCQCYQLADGNRDSPANRDPH